MYDTTVNNYLGITTGGMTVDCPHRERRGYGGDGHTSYQFGLANYPVGAFFNKWMRDFADVQGLTGGSDTKMPVCTTPGEGASPSPDLDPDLDPDPNPNPNRCLLGPEHRSDGERWWWAGLEWLCCHQSMADLQHVWG